MTFSHTSLPDLPPEVLDLVISSVDRNGLLSLRLTSKQLCAATPKDPIFSQLRFVFSKFSLAGLLRLSEHPELAPCVRLVSFGTIRLGPAYIPGPELEAQTDFIKSGQHIDLISKALINLRKHGKDVTLGIFDYCNLRKGYGSDKTYGASPSSWSDRAGETLRDMFAATEKAPFPLRKIDLDFCVSSRDIPTSRNTPVLLLTDLERFFVDPDYLLNFDISMKLYNPDSGNTIKMESEESHLAFYGRRDLLEDCTYFKDFQSHFPFYYLYTRTIRTLVLKGCTIEVSAIQRLLLWWAGSLERLELIDLCATYSTHSTQSPDHYPRPIISLFGMIQKVRFLQHFSVDKCSMLMLDYRANSRPQFQLETNKWQGRDQIGAGIERLIQKIEHEAETLETTGSEIPSGT